MRLDLGNGDVELDINFWTLVVYEQNFGSNMIGDLFGEVTVSEDDDADGDGQTFTINYEKYNWNACVQAMWASAKAHDNDIENYESWCRGMTNVNMWPLINQFRSEVLARLFRTGATDSE